MALSATITLTTLTLLLAATSPSDSLLPAPVTWALVLVSTVLLLICLVELARRRLRSTGRRKPRGQHD
ncbi:hypothetical protein ACOQFL_03345 [Actinopolyspora sp. H202]|uniref:hypothetical protein n=1 Tax=Actinopolyspora sp. H202 TaxID=1500456 RepID=UPI003EE5364F